MLKRNHLHGSLIPGCPARLMDHVDKDPRPHVLKRADVKVEPEMKGESWTISQDGYDWHENQYALLSTLMLKGQGGLSLPCLPCSI